MGQGACMAIEDSVVLAKVLDNSKQEEIPMKLQNFVDIRFERTSFIVKISKQIGSTATWNNSIACNFRNFMVKLIRKAVERRILKAIEFDYQNLVIN